MEKKNKKKTKNCCYIFGDFTAAFMSDMNFLSDYVTDSVCSETSLANIDVHEGVKQDEISDHTLCIDC